VLYLVSVKQKEVIRHNIIEEEKKINLGDGIYVKQSAFEMASNCNDPSKFVITLSYSIWGYSTLANRCVKQMGSKDNRPLVTPQKVQAVRKSFKEWLHMHGYQNQALLNELKQLNVYLSRAITGARRHLKLDTPKQHTALNVSNETESLQDLSEEHMLKDVSNKNNSETSDLID